MQVYHNDKMVTTKTESKYVCRGKQGGRQMNADKGSKIMSSVGSNMRRENEKMLHLVMETPEAETVAAFMSDEQFTADRIAAGVHVDTTKVTFLKG